MHGHDQPLGGLWSKENQFTPDQMSELKKAFDCFGLSMRY